jgi:hypothetical protein
LSDIDRSQQAVRRLFPGFRERRCLAFQFISAHQTYPK